MTEAATLPYGLSETRPLIILGMHRSGTSLTARLLGQAGMQMGVDLPMNDESRPCAGFFCLRFLIRAILLLGVHPKGATQQPTLENKGA